MAGGGAYDGGYFDEQMWYGRIGLDNQQGLIAKREADEIIRKLSFKAFEAEYKAVVIWLPEKMGVEASNGLLKILEEPWDKTLFLLVSVAPQMLLPTILSRVQEVGVPPVGADDMERWLAGTYGMETQKAAALARLAGGDMVELRKIAERPEGEASGEDFDNFASLMRFSYNDRHLELLGWAENMARWGAKPRNVFQVCSFPVAGKLHAFGRNGKYILSLGTGKGVLRKVRPFRRQRQYRAVGGGEPYRPAAYKPERQCEDSLHALRSVG